MILKTIVETTAKIKPAMHYTESMTLHSHTEKAAAGRIQESFCSTQKNAFCLFDQRMWMVEQVEYAKMQHLSIVTVCQRGNQTEDQWLQAKM